MLKAEQQLRRIIGYKDPAKLVIAIEHDHARQTSTPDQSRGRYPRHRTAITPGTAITKIHDERDILSASLR